MLYRDLGNTGYKASLLGMGAMRLPYIDRDDLQKGVAREEAYELIRAAVAGGVNYFDTAQGYHAGDSEAVLGEALEGGLREKVWITTKHPFWQPADEATVRANLEKTLKKLRTSYIDTWLMHGIGTGNWQYIQDAKIYNLFERLRDEGLIRTIGFSYHGHYEHFCEVVKAYPWDVTLAYHNMLDVDKEVTADGIRVAAEAGIGVTIMEPLRGGGLCYAPRGVAAVYDAAEAQRTPTEWAMRYLADLPGTHSIVSGMSNMAQLQENLKICSSPDMLPGCMSPADKNVISAARDAYNAIVTIPCTSCNYCLPCPQGVDIPGCFRNYNDGHRFEFFDQSRRSYMFARRGGRGAEKCTACGVCTPKCPMNIDIPKELTIAHDKLKGWDE
jgi:predicted aldo/keto reductase-like oxidoreductase